VSDLEAFMAELLGPDTTVVMDGTGLEVDLNTFLSMAMAILDDDTPPKRSTPEYAQLIAHVAHLDELHRVVGSLQHLHSDYGWRGPLDVMSEWIAQMENSPAARDPKFRDLTGAVDLTTLLVIHVDDEQRLRLAADKKEQYEAKGLPPHEAFRRGLAETEAGIALAQRWLPYFRAALSAAHTAKDRRAITAELFKAPGRTDREELLKAAMVVGTAAYALRHHDALAARHEAVTDGSEVTHNPAIAPGWNAGGGYMPRSALRRNR
jgi:hypothetical protein